MDKKKLLRWFAIMLSANIILSITITYIDRLDDDKQRLYASYEPSTIQDKVELTKDLEKKDDTEMVTNEPETEPESESQSADTDSGAGEAETLNVEKETVIGSDGHTVRDNHGARVFADVDPGKPMVALTFDDGPSEYTEKILKVLKKYNARATFFVVGYKIENNSDVILKTYNQGCEIGSHTFGHVEMDSVPLQQVMSEIETTETLIQKITGQKRVIIRPPYGAIDDNVLQKMKNPIILWSIDTLDWQTRDSRQTINNVMEQVEDGSIILMHDTYKESFKAAETIIKKLTEQGYQLVTVSELGYYKLGGLACGIKYGAMKGE